MDFTFLTTYHGTTLRLFAWCMFLGLSFAVCAVTFQRRVPGKIVRRLLREQAHSAEEAKTLTELGIVPSFWLRVAMRGKHSAFRRVVAIADGGNARAELREEPTDGGARDGRSVPNAAGKRTATKSRRAAAPAASDYLNGALYIPADGTERAESIFGRDRGSVAMAILGVLAGLAVSLLITFFAEELLTMLGNFMNRYF